MPRIKKYLSFVIGIAIILAFFTPFEADATYAKSLNEMTGMIYDHISDRDEEFTISYSGTGLSETSAPNLIKNAISYSFKNMFLLSQYSYKVSPTSLYISVKYKTDNGYPYIYVSDFDQLKVVMERVISENVGGINVYLSSDVYDDDPNAVSQEIMAVYKEAEQNAVDDYSMYNVSSIGVAVSSTKYLSSREGEYIATITFSYSQTKEEEEVVNAFVKDSVTSLNLDEKSDAEKVEAINRFIKNYTTYSYTGDSKDFTAYGLYESKTAVCQGYSMLACKMLWEAGLRNRIVTGTAFDTSTGADGNHMWNAVCIEGNWRYLDVTWNDAYKSQNPYLAMTEEEILADHSFDTDVYNFENYEKYATAYLDKVNSVIKLVIGEPTMEIGKDTILIDEKSNDTVPVIINDRTHLPIRALIEGLGGAVVWDGNNRQITINYNDYMLDIWIDSRVVILNGITQYIETPPVIINNRTMVPVRMVAELLGMGVNWDENSQLVTITAK